jgi:tetrahydromethanopterin S-methyltransferase subunit D
MANLIVVVTSTMTVFGLPTVTFVMIVATVLAGSAGMIHYLIVHKFLGKEFSDPQTGSVE